LRSGEQCYFASYLFICVAARLVTSITCHDLDIDQHLKFKLVVFGIEQGVSFSLDFLKKGKEITLN
jgi:hypothetical protein